MTWTLDNPTKDDLAQLPRSDLKARGSKDGHIYVIEFSFGTVKVGQTTDARKRMRQHLDDAFKFGGSINRLWISRRHPQWIDNEAEMIIACREVAKPSTWHEYFADLDYESVVAFASRLPMGHEPAPAVFPTSRWEAFDEWSRTDGALALVVGTPRPA